MKISAIIPVFNRKEITLECMRQIHDMALPEHQFEIVVVDDGSTDGTADAISGQYPNVTVLREDGDLWWTGAVNVGVKYALKNGADGVLLLNDDLNCADGFLNELLKVVDRDPSMLVSSIKLDESEGSKDEIITAGFQIGGWLDEITNPYQYQAYDASAIPEIIEADILTGASLYIPNTVFNEIGIFDEKTFPHNWGDFEFTLRAKMAGYKCVVATRSIVHTEYNRNYGRFYFRESSRRDYLKNLFDVKRFGYGYRFLFRKSYMHRSFIKATILFVRGSLTLTRKVLMKTLLPNSMLR